MQLREQDSSLGGGPEPDPRASNDSRKLCFTGLMGGRSEQNQYGGKEGELGGGRGGLTSRADGLLSWATEGDPGDPGHTGGTLSHS